MKSALFLILCSLPFSAFADLTCTETSGGLANLALTNEVNVPTKVVLTSAAGKTEFVASVGSADDGVFGETVYDLVSINGEKAKLTIVQMPSFTRGGACGRGGCWSPPHSSSRLSASLELQSQPPVTLEFSCHEISAN